jgi:2-C-methyl-D-erythritol 4-phosphate cytidylyltransferase/2-C-methyl-D-erythritol 2,4-cyclodiphosphate synthase
VTVVAIILAAGRGSRAAAAAGVPKQYATVGGEAVLTHTIRAFAAHPAVDLVQVVTHPDDREAYRPSPAAPPVRPRALPVSRRFLRTRLAA